MKKHEPDALRLASNAQLWRLNTLGRLALVEKAKPVTSPEARDVLDALLGEAA